MATKDIYVNGTKLNANIDTNNALIPGGNPYSVTDTNVQNLYTQQVSDSGTYLCFASYTYSWTANVNANACIYSAAINTSSSSLGLYNITTHTHGNNYAGSASMNLMHIHTLAAGANVYCTFKAIQLGANVSIEQNGLKFQAISLY